MKPAAPSWVRWVGRILLFAGGLQLALVIVSLFFGLKLALWPGMSATGWVAGFFIPLIQLFFTVSALRFALKFFRGRQLRPSLLRVLNALLLQLLFFGFFALLFWLKSLEYKYPGQWFVMDYLQLPKHELFGRSAPVTLGIFAPLLLHAGLSLLGALVSGAVFLLPRTQRSLAEPRAAQIAL